MIRLEITHHDPSASTMRTLMLSERDVPAESIDLPAILDALDKKKRVRKPKAAQEKP